MDDLLWAFKPGNDIRSTEEKLKSAGKNLAK
jgi:hypothetical protein